uniref:Uncharacterized protein n=1 Tax=Chenopodium quinoa TaxID=63459 RepID=A0A803KQJ4_CHEQI
MSYEDEHVPGYGHVQIASQTISENWDVIRDNQSGLVNFDSNNNSHIRPAEDCKSVASSCTNTLTFLQNSPGTEVLKSRRRNSLGDIKSVSSCNNCKPATISSIDYNDSKSTNNNKYSNMVVPLTDSHATMTTATSAAAAPHKKSRGMIMSWLFKRRQKNETSSPARTDDQSEEVSQVMKDFGNSASVEMLRKELIDANQKKDAALVEVSEMRSSFGELRRKLENLESYCEDLKKALRQAVTKREKPSDGRSNEDSEMPVSEEVMVEGFLQIVSEARLSPYKLSVNSRYSKAVFYHLEAIINQAFYQDFENCVFQKNGMPKLLDPQQQRQAQFQSFASLRNLSWNEVLKKGTKYYSEEFIILCISKMYMVTSFARVFFHSTFEYITSGRE